MKHLKTTQCCGHTFTANDIKGRLMSQQEALGTNDPHLYGGNVERFARTECPKCGKEYMMWMKRQSPNFRIMTISEVADTKPPRGRPKKETSA